MAIMMALDAHKRKLIEIVAITLVKGNANLKDAETNVLRVLEIFELDNIVRFVVVYCTRFKRNYFAIKDILKSKLISLCLRYLCMLEMKIILLSKL